MKITGEQLQRYSRHLALPETGKPQADSAKIIFQTLMNELHHFYINAFSQIMTGHGMEPEKSRCCEENISW